MKITALAAWYGSNRLLAEHVGKLLAGCEWVGIPFAGGMCELAHVKARTVVVSDKHRHVINLATVVRDDAETLQDRLDALPFHPDTLAAAQLACRRREDGGLTGTDCALWWAADYFVCVWMARSATAGTDGEFDAGLSVRWNAGGGDSVVRFRNATEALTDWQMTMRRCTFVVQDVFEFLGTVKDQHGHGLYLDPPFPGPGDKYRHKFDEGQHRRLAFELGAFNNCRVVCRFYDHPLIRELYPEADWTWHHLAGRKQSNAAAPEVLLVNASGA